MGIGFPDRRAIAISSVHKFRSGRTSGNVPDGFYHPVLAFRLDLAVPAVGCNHGFFILSFRRISRILRQPFFHRRPGLRPELNPGILDAPSDKIVSRQ